MDIGTWALDRQFGRRFVPARFGWLSPSGRAGPFLIGRFSRSEPPEKSHRCDIHKLEATRIMQRGGCIFISPFPGWRLLDKAQPVPGGS